MYSGRVQPIKDSLILKCRIMTFVLSSKVMFSILRLPSSHGTVLWDRSLDDFHARVMFDQTTLCDDSLD